MLANLPIVTAILAQSFLHALSLSLVGSFGFLPHEVRHSKGGYGGHCSSGVVHVSAKADTVGLCTASFTDVSNSYVFILALWADHFQFFLSSLNYTREYVVLTGLFYYPQPMKWNSGF